MSEQWEFFSSTGGWTSRPVAVEQGEDFDVMLSRLGWELRDVDGDMNEYEPYLAVYQRKHGADAPARFLVEFSPNGDGSQLILCDDVGSLLALRQMLQPLIALAAFREEFRKIVEMAERAFEAWHGHPAHCPCDDCDVEEMRRRAARARRKAERE